MNDKNKQMTRNELATQLAREEKLSDSMKKAVESIAKNLGVESIEFDDLGGDAKGWLTSAHLNEAVPVAGFLRGARLYETDDLNKPGKTKLSVGYTVELAMDVDGVRAVGDTVDPINYKKGDVVIVGERFSMRPWRLLPVNHPVIMIPVEKIKLDNGKRNFWRMKVKAGKTGKVEAADRLQAMIDASWEAIQRGEGTLKADPWEVEQ